MAYSMCGFKMVKNFILEMRTLVGYPNVRCREYAGPARNNYCNMRGVSVCGWIEPNISTEVVFHYQNILVVPFALTEEQVIEMQYVV